MMTRAEFTAAVRAHHRGLWLVALGRVGDAAAAEDVLQEAYLVAWRKRGEYRPGTNLRAWLATIVRLTGMDAAKRRRRRNETGGAAVEAVVAPAEEAEQGCRGSTALPPDQRSFDDVTTAALRELTAEARTCLLLKVVEDYSYAEISESLGIAEGTAMSHVHRAKAKLRRRLLATRADRAES